MLHLKERFLADTVAERRHAQVFIGLHEVAHPGVALADEVSPGFRLLVDQLLRGVKLRDDESKIELALTPDLIHSVTAIDDSLLLDAHDAFLHLGELEVTAVQRFNAILQRAWIMPLDGLGFHKVVVLTVDLLSNAFHKLSV